MSDDRTTLCRMSASLVAPIVLALVVGAIGCDRSTLNSSRPEASEVHEEHVAEAVNEEAGRDEIKEPMRRRASLDYHDVPAEKETPALSRSEEEWKERLSTGAYRVLREEATELPNSGRLLDNSKEGVYVCGGCGEPLFSSETKFESGTGWPSFYDVIEEGTAGLVRDSSGGIERVEVYCTHCGGHLGHVFDDGPEPTGLRYCINSAAMDFESADDMQHASE